MGCSHSNVAKSTVKLDRKLSPTVLSPKTDYLGITNVQTVGERDDNCRGGGNRNSSELLQGQTIQYVSSALSRHLDGYEFHYTTCSNKPNDIKSSMKVEKNDSICLFPDNNCEFLSYSQEPNEYVLYYGSKAPNSVRFLYQWEEGRETFITSPYIPLNAEHDISVPCAPKINITCHLLKRDPVLGIIEGLAQLSSVVFGVSHPNMGLVGPEFEWNFDGAFPIAFNVMSGTRSHWQEVDGNSGEVKFTNNNANVLILRLVRTQ